MRKEKMYLVCPSLSSYENKSEDDKARIRDIIKDWYNKLKAYGFSIHMFAEDMLGVSILGKHSDIVWMTTIGKSDYNFLVNSVEGYPVEYFDIDKVPCKTDIMALSVNKVKNVNLRDFINESCYS